MYALCNVVALISELERLIVKVKQDFGSVSVASWKNVFLIFYFLFLSLVGCTINRGDNSLIKASQLFLFCLLSKLVLGAAI